MASLCAVGLFWFQKNNFQNAIDKNGNQWYYIGMVSDVWLSVKDITERLHVDNETVLRWLWSGKLKGYQAGKIWRIKESDFNAFLKPNKMETDVE